MLNVQSYTERPYIKMRWPELKRAVADNHENFPTLLDIHYELHFRTPKTPVTNLLNSLERKLAGIVDENPDDPDSLERLQICLERERTDFEIKLTAIVDKRLDQLFIDDCFPFPSTDTPIEHGEIDIINREAKGLLRQAGYARGQKAIDMGLDNNSRRVILENVYLKSIPQQIEVDDMEKWGTPNTGQRLKEIVYSIARFVNQERRNNRGNYEMAITDGRNDLKYLKIKHYNGRYDWTYLIP